MGWYTPSTTVSTSTSLSYLCPSCKPQHREYKSPLNRGIAAAPDPEPPIAAELNVNPAPVAAPSTEPFEELAGCRGGIVMENFEVGATAGGSVDGEVKEKAGTGGRGAGVGVGAGAGAGVATGDGEKAGVAEGGAVSAVVEATAKRGIAGAGTTSSGGPCVCLRAVPTCGLRFLER